MPVFDSKSDMLLQLIALCGELPITEIRRLPMTTAYRYKVVGALRQQRWIRQYVKDDIRAYRLTAAGRNHLLQQNPERFAFLKDTGLEVNMYRSQINRRLRLHTAAQVYTTMILAGFSIFADEKTLLFQYRQDAGNRIAYYNSSETKDLGIEGIKVRSSRATGVLLGPGRILLVYNTGQTLMKWESQTELRLYALIESKLCRENSVYEDDDLGGLMLGNSMDMAYELLTNSGRNKRNSFQLRDTFLRFYYCPSTTQGIQQLRCTLRPDVMADLRALLLSDLLPPAPDAIMEQDAVDAQGRPVLLALDFDMARIKRYHDACEMFQIQGHLCCYDFQAAVLEKYMAGTHAVIESVNLEKVIRRYNLM